MRINGEWLLCDDGIVRPIVRGEVETANGGWFPCEFLVDVGANRTVLTATLVSFLGLTSHHVASWEVGEAKRRWQKSKRGFGS